MKERIVRGGGGISRIILAILAFVLLLGSALLLSSCGESSSGTAWYVSTGVPSDSTGTLGDFYLDTSTYNLYQMTASGWSVIGNIQGSQGEKGDSGDNGTSWYVGTGEPDSSVNCAVGDFYLDSSTYDLYQYTSWGWLQVGNIQGNSPLVSIDENGFWVIDGETTDVYATGVDGTTPTVAINSDGYWVINGTVTNVNAYGVGQTSSVLISTDVSASTFKDKTITFLGDSITAGTGADPQSTNKWTTLLCDTLGAVENNMGIGGTTLANRWQNDGSYTTIEDVPTDTDFLIIALGANDRDYADVSLGVLGDTGTDTIYGLLENYCIYITENLPNVTTYFATPLGLAEPVDQTCKSGYTMLELCEAIKEVAARYNIPVMDMNNLAGIYYNSESDNNTDTYLTDGTHPNNSGHQIMANAWYNWLMEGWQYVDEDDSVSLTFYNSTSSTVINRLKGSTYTLPTPETKDGYVFVHYVCSDGHTYSSGSTINVYTDLTFNAFYAPGQSAYTLTIHAGDGSASYETIQLEYGQTLSSAGYELTGTHTSYGMVATWYSDEDYTTEFTNTTAVTSDMDIYAYWEMDSSLFIYENIDEETTYIVGYSSTLVNNASYVTSLIFPKLSSDGLQVVGIKYVASSSLSSGAGVVSQAQRFLNLQEIVFPEGYQSLTQFQYYNVSSTSTVNTITKTTSYTVSIPSTLTSICETSFVGARVSAFIVDSGNTTYFAIDGALCRYFNNGSIIELYKYNHGNGLTEVEISSSIVYLANNSLNLNDMTTLILHENIKISYYTTYRYIITGCVNLKTIQIKCTATTQSGFESYYKINSVETNSNRAFYDLFYSFPTDAAIFDANAQIIVENDFIKEYLVELFKSVASLTNTQNSVFVDSSGELTDLGNAVYGLYDNVVVKS